MLIEAAASGRPVITTDVPGCRDAIRNGETGILVPPKDSVMLADKIKYLVENPKLVEEMGKAARALAEKEFSINSVIDHHIKIYKAFIT